MIKIPATAEGSARDQRCSAEGISVNVTLIFSLARYREVMDAFLAGMEQARGRRLHLATIDSVASFFVSRVDTEIDKRLDALGTDEAKALRGKAAVANAQLRSRPTRSLRRCRWKALAAAGAKAQRPLWASTGVKDPSYPDTLYVDELVTAGVVNTMPEATLEAVANHSDAGDDTVRGSYGADARCLGRSGRGRHRLRRRGESAGGREGVDSRRAWQDLLDAVTKSLNSKGVDGE